MAPRYIAPAPDLTSFNCPACDAFAKQTWGELQLVNDEEEYDLDETIGARCEHCYNVSIWKSGRMVYPFAVAAPDAADDMPSSVKDIFEEARQVAALSPRAAAALLRLAVQILLKELGGKGKNIDADIANLVKEGLSPRIQQALDSIRVVGNNAVHPGTIDINDNPEMAQALFGLINFIVQEMITRPDQVEAFYASLPQSALDAIKKRDSNS